MRNLSIRIAGGCLILAALIWSLSCNTNTPNNNVAQNDGTNNADVEADASTRGTSDACDEGDDTTLEKKRDLVAADLVKQIRGKEKLRKQYDEGLFRFVVVVAQESLNDKDGYLVAYFEGRVHGENELENLSEILNNFKKDRCLLKVVVVPDGELPTGTKRSSRGFEWSLCEWPARPCPDGRCLEICVGFDGNSNTNGNGNRITNTNSSNGGSNSNANY